MPSLGMQNTIEQSLASMTEEPMTSVELLANRPGLEMTWRLRLARVSSVRRDHVPNGFPDVLLRTVLGGFLSAGQLRSHCWEEVINTAAWRSCNRMT